MDKRSARIALAVAALAVPAAVMVSALPASATVYGCSGGYSDGGHSYYVTDCSATKTSEQFRAVATCHPTNGGGTWTAYGAWGIWYSKSTAMCGSSAYASGSGYQQT